MAKIFLAQFQIRQPAAIAPGPRDRYRKSVEEVVVIASAVDEIASVIAANVKLAPGEEVEVVQRRELHPGKKVFARVHS